MSRGPLALGTGLLWARAHRRGWMGTRGRTLHRQSSMKRKPRGRCAARGRWRRWPTGTQILRGRCRYDARKVQGVATKLRARSGVLFGDNLPVSVQDFVDVHEDAVLLHRHFAVLLKKEIESLCQSALPSGTQKIGLDAVDVGVATPDDTERLEEITIDVKRGR